MSLSVFNEEKKIQLLKDTICKGATNDEFELFAYTCKRLRLDPFSRQIYPVKRWNNQHCQLIRRTIFKSKNLAAKKSILISV